MEKLLYPRERFATAVEYLATSPGSLQQRLMLAYNSLMPLQDRDFNNHPIMLAQYEEIKKRLTIRPDFRGEGEVAATLRDMPDTEAVQLAKMIFNFNHNLQKVGSSE